VESSKVSIKSEKCSSR